MPKMLLKCAICNRPLAKAEFFIGGYAIGPTCAKNRGLTGSVKVNPSIAIRNDQPDLFEVLDEQKEKGN